MPDPAARHAAGHHRPLPAGAADAAARPRRAIGAAQLTLSALISRFGVGAAASCGPLADRFGRRPVLLAGLALYVAGQRSAARRRRRIELLIAWRALQGAAMAAAVTCGRSIVRDLYEPHDGARVMSQALTRPRLHRDAAPLLGGVIVDAFGWRAALLALAVVRRRARWRSSRGAAPRRCRARNPHATRPAPLLRNWPAVAGQPDLSRLGAAARRCTYGGLFVLARRLVVRLHRRARPRAARLRLRARDRLARLHRRHLLLPAPAARATACAAPCGAAAGFTLRRRRLMARAQPRRRAHACGRCCVPQWLYTIGHGIHQPCGQAGAVGPFPEKAGTAAALSGFVMTLAAFAVGLWLGAHARRHACTADATASARSAPASPPSRGRWCSATASRRVVAAVSGRGATR